MVDRRVGGLDEPAWWRCSHRDGDVQCQYAVEDTSEPSAHTEHANSPMILVSDSQSDPDAATDSVGN
jgi:hypothetical protein